MAPVLWREGCLAEQCREYEVAKRLFRKSLTIGILPWRAHVLPTLGWARLGLGEVEKAQVYFQKTLSEANAQECLPVSLDAQVRLIDVQQLRTQHDSQQSQTLQQRSPRSGKRSNTMQSPRCASELRRSPANSTGCLAQNLYDLPDVLRHAA